MNPLVFIFGVQSAIVVTSSLRVEERFIPGEYLIKAYPDLSYNRSKDFVGFLTNLRLFFGDGKQLHDISLGSVDGITWGRVRRWSVWILLICEIISLILMVIIIGFVLVFLVPVLWFLWREDAVSLKVGPKEIVLFGEPRTLNDIAKNIRLHQAVLRSGEAGGALGQRILEAMPMEAQPPPKEGGPLAPGYARQVAADSVPTTTMDISSASRTDEDDGISTDEEGDQAEPGMGKKKRQVDDWQGREALGLIEGQASDKDQSLAAKLAYLLWAGPPNPTKLMLIGGHILLFLAILVYVISDTIAYFNEEAASPGTRFAQLLVLAGLGAFLAVISRQVDNRYRGVEPQKDEIILKLGYKDYPLRYLCHRTAHFFILSSLALTFLFMNLTGFMVGAFLGSFIMAIGRISNLLIKPQWMHQTKPWPKWRTIKLGWNTVRLFTVFITFLVLFPFFQDHDAAVPSAQLDGKVHNGWQLEADHSVNIQKLQHLLHCGSQLCQHRNVIDQHRQLRSSGHGSVVVDQLPVTAVRGRQARHRGSSGPGGVLGEHDSVTRVQCAHVHDRLAAMLGGERHRNLRGALTVLKPHLVSVARGAADVEPVGAAGIQTLHQCSELILEKCVVLVAGTGDRRIDSLQGSTHGSHPHRLRYFLYELIMQRRLCSDKCGNRKADRMRRPLRSSTSIACFTAASIASSSPEARVTSAFTPPQNA